MNVAAWTGECNFGSPAESESDPYAHPKPSGCSLAQGCRWPPQ
eukprot:CAMPEP_0115174352 /NCGR_PEP_ID=MMETSP0270-20121206/3794_1 /TAXON_ID=71861 /ORGANISM="Scrippsiella trochoidea, Strain CCMP3099" /LENGTH=42 /DNA_ID= /DNA_START= /DNA_END= /DNA_ORIENTATION=